MNFWEWLKNLFKPKAAPVKVEPLPRVNDDRLSAKNYFGSPQVKWLLQFYGWTEHNIQQSKTLAKKIWKVSGFPLWDTLLGRSRAWCEAVQNGADEECGYKGTRRADAISSKTWGDECPDWFGARLHMQHPSGGNHATRFLFWYDKSKLLAACLGGNQSDALNITIYDGRKEKFSKFRWAKGQSPGRVVTREEFEKAFPQFTNYKFSGSTR